MLSFRISPDIFISGNNVSKRNKFLLRCKSSFKAAIDPKPKQNEVLNQNLKKAKDSNSKAPVSSVFPFSHAKLGPFKQERPSLDNQFHQDSLLKGYLCRHVGEEHLPAVMSDLGRFGGRVTEDLYRNSLQMEAEQPKLEQLDAWGSRVDRLVTCRAWQDMKGIAAEEGLVASAYERNFGEWSRLYQFAKLYLYEPSAGLYGCPLAMTNGAAKTIEILKDTQPWIYDRAFGRLTSRDPSKFWTSGQWMTEKRGGSDVAGGTETLAYEQPDGSYKLYGYKWFSSATDADITLTLARVVDKHGNVVRGTAGLSLFYLEVQLDNGNMNGIQMMKLKNKFGTRQLPTAELLIDGAIAHRISDEGRGVASIAQMLTITRIHTAVHASSAMRRMVNLARDFATRRKAFGKFLHQHPLHMKTLAAMEVETRAAAIFVLEVARLYGRQELGDCGGQQQKMHEAEVLRLVVPLLKLYTGKQSVAVTSEGLESFGGQGYIEDTDLPRILRDTQVCSIWEGTTNILSLDVLRAVSKSKGSVLVHFKNQVHHHLSGAHELSELASSAAKVVSSLDQTLALATKMTPDHLMMASRDLSYSLARIYMGALLLDHAGYTKHDNDIITAKRWCEQDLSLLHTSNQGNHFSDESQKKNADLVFDGYLRPDRLD